MPVLPEDVGVIHVSVLAPVLGRPERALPLVESLAASVTHPVFDAAVLFLCSPGDVDQIAACMMTGAETIVVNWDAGSGDYARKINHGADRAAYGYDNPGDFVLLGADDLMFHRGWLEAALIVQLDTGACVIGTNDLGNRSVMNGSTSTHPLVHVNYIDEGLADGTPGLMFEGYDHNFVDTEFIETAKSRGTFAPALLSHVEHLHPFWGKGITDATYAKGAALLAEDRKLHRSRAHLWERKSVRL